MRAILICLLVTAAGGAAAAAAHAPTLVLATKTTAILLMDIIGAGEFRDRVEAMGGYDVSESSRVISSKHH